MDNSYRKFVRDEVRDLPFYVPGKPIDELKRERGLIDVVKLASNENSWGFSSGVVDAITEALPEIFRYPDSKTHNLRLNLAASFGLMENHLIFGNGSEEIIKLIAMAFFRTGDEILMGLPTFPRYSSVSKMMGAIPIEISCDNGYYPLDGILNNVTSRTRAIFLCNPNNPTGTAVGEGDLRRFMSQVPKDVLVIFDEAYYEFMDIRFSGLAFLKDHPIIVLRTFSKAYGLAGLRIGFAAACPELIDGLERVREPFNVNILAQAAALAAWNDEKHLQKVVEQNSGERSYVTGVLAKSGVQIFPSQTNFVMAFFPEAGSKLNERLLDRGIIVRPGVAFGYPDALRITIGTREENDRMLDALSDLQVFCRKDIDGK